MISAASTVWSTCLRSAGTASTKPSDVLNVGDKIDVYVINFDKENHKISLGHRDPNLNPWKVFTETYSVGDIAKSKIVKLMPFGAFAEVLPGTDGLIHISQIANRRIGQPSEVLSVGDGRSEDHQHRQRSRRSPCRSVLSPPAPAASREETEDEPREAALVYSVSSDGTASGEAPEVG